MDEVTTGDWDDVAGTLTEDERAESVGGNSASAGMAEAGSRVSSSSVLLGSSRRGSLRLRDPSMSPLPLLLPESASNDKTRGAHSASNALRCAAVPT
jgi:hypothetical protein